MSAATFLLRAFVRGREVESSCEFEDGGEDEETLSGFPPAPGKAGRVREGDRDGESDGDAEEEYDMKGAASGEQRKWALESTDVTVEDAVNVICGDDFDVRRLRCLIFSHSRVPILSRFLPAPFLSPLLSPLPSLVPFFLTPWVS